MCKETRVFDILTVYADKWPGQKVALARKEDGVWKKYSPADYLERTDKVSYALIESGIEPGDKVMFPIDNRPEWNILDMAVMRVGAITVPFDPTLNEEEFQYILTHSDAKMVIAEGHTPYGQLLALGGQHPHEEELRRRMAAVRPEDCATIVYTSDTTGHPEGVMLSHSNLMHQLYNLRDIPARWSKVAFSFLPVSDTYERVQVYLYQYLGMSVYYPESMDSVTTDMKEVRPTMMSVVPNMLESLFASLKETGQTLKGMQGKVYRWAMGIAERYKTDPSERSGWYNLRLQLADRLVFRKIRARLGTGKLDMLVSEESVEPKTASVFSALKMPVYEGYGMTEASPIIALSSDQPFAREEGAVGPALPGVEIKVTPNGEICCRGHNVMMGYYKNKELTNKRIDTEGWFHTGDHGYLNEYGQLCITKRLKRFIKRNIAPKNFQNIGRLAFS